MSSAAVPGQTGRRLRPAVEPDPQSSSRFAHQPAAGRRPYRARTLFAVSFSSAMGDREAAYLQRTLGLTMHLHPKLFNSPAAAGVLRLDADSALLLRRGGADDRWLLEGRSWGNPSAAAVSSWRCAAASAARGLDPSARLTESTSD